MCGICGKLNFVRSKPVDPNLIRNMMDRIVHRGPDGSGEYISGPVGLGHRRLSIIDLSSGDQPICNEDTNIWIVYNGEIYNFLELRTELEKLGHKFRSNTDTEVIIHLYEEIGENCVSKLRGMFAFALWDESKQVLFIARDRVGIKPLYYSNTGDSIVFGSEIKTIISDPDVNRDINFRAIDRFLTYYYLPGNDTLLSNVKKLEPGHYLKIQDGNLAINKYWDLNFNHLSYQGTFKEASSDLKHLLRKTVKDHMVSDVPVGILLSGGVDSTGILRYAVEQTNKQIRTFTIGFDGHHFADERPFASLAAKNFGTEHHEITITAKDFQDFLPKYIWHMEEPICEPPAVALYFISELAKKNSIKVLLSGEGGDEAFGGYQNYRNLGILENLKKLFGSQNGFLKTGFDFLGHLGWDRSEYYSSLISQIPSEYYLSRTSSPVSPFNKLKSVLYKKAFLYNLNGFCSYMPTKYLFESMHGKPFLNQILYVDTKTWLPDDLLIKADKITMATSVELRVPFLDHQVLEFAASLPTSYKVKGLTLKRILKDVLSESVPKEILNRKKTGFPVPYNNWLQNEMKDFVLDTLCEGNISINTYFEKSEINKLIKMNHKTGKFAKEIFSLLTLELWHTSFLK